MNRTHAYLTRHHTITFTLRTPCLPETLTIYDRAP